MDNFLSNAGSFLSNTGDAVGNAVKSFGQGIQDEWQKFNQPVNAPGIGSSTPDFNVSAPGIGQSMSPLEVAARAQDVINNVANQAPMQVNIPQDVANTPVLGGVAQMGAQIANAPGQYLQGIARTGQDLGNSLQGQDVSGRQWAGDISEIAQLPLLLAGGGAAAESAGGGLSRSIAQGGLEGAKYGAGFGALNGLQSGRDIADNKQYAQNLLANTAIGAGSGALLGGATSGIIAGLRMVKGKNLVSFGDEANGITPNAAEQLKELMPTVASNRVNWDRPGYFAQKFTNQPTLDQFLKDNPDFNNHAGGPQALQDAHGIYGFISPDLTTIPQTGQEKNLTVDSRIIKQLTENNGDRDPIIVRENPKNPGTYDVVDGHHAVVIGRALGLDKLPAIILDDRAPLLSDSYQAVKSGQLQPVNVVGGSPLDQQILLQKIEGKAKTVDTADALAKQTQAQQDLPQAQAIAQNAANQVGGTIQAKVKDVKSLAEKVADDKGRTLQNTPDGIQSTVIAPTVDAAHQAANIIEQTPGIDVLKHKVDVTNPKTGYYGPDHIQVELPDGQRLEIQTHTPQTVIGRELSHVGYKPENQGTGNRLMNLLSNQQRFINFGAEVGQKEKQIGNMPLEEVTKSLSSEPIIPQGLSTQLREDFLNRRNVRIGESGQTALNIEKIVPKDDLNATYFYQELKNNPQKMAKVSQLLQQDDKRLAPYADDLQKALNPTPEMKQAAFIIDQYYQGRATVGTQLGYIKGTLNDYITHIVQKGNDASELPDVPRSTMTRTTPFGQGRVYPTAVDLILNGGKPATLNPADVIRIYGEREAVANASVRFLQDAKTSGFGGWFGSSDVPDGWTKLDPYGRKFEYNVAALGKDIKEGKTPVGQNDIDQALKVGTITQDEADQLRQGGNALMVHKVFAVPNAIADAMKPVIEPDWLKKVGGIRAWRLGQTWAKYVNLSLSFFHAKALTLTAAASDPTVVVKSVTTDMNSPEFRDAELDLLNHKGTSPILGGEYNAYRNIQRTGGNILTNNPITNAFNNLAKTTSGITFDTIQRKYKVLDYSNKVASWIADHPDATDAELNVVKDKIGTYVNSTYGGLNWETMGLNKSQLTLLRSLMLAPDWCVDSKTRVMTKNGWKYYDELSIGDEMLAFDPETKKYKWSKLKDKYVNEKYSGKMVKIKSYYRYIYLTPNHKCYIYNFTKKKYEIILAKDLKTNSLIPRCAEFDLPNKEIFDDKFIKLVGWIVTDGYVKKSKVTLKDGTIKTFRYGKIIQSKPSTVKILKEMDLIYHVDKSNSDHDKFKSNYNKHVFTIPQSIFDLMEKEKISESLNWEFLSKLSKRQLKLLYDTMMLGDGTGQNRFCGKEKEIFFMTMIQTMLGWASTFYQQEVNCWRTRHIKSKNIFCFKGKQKPEEVDYQGIIWCPSVDTGFWLAEREGLIFITGNTFSNFALLKQATTGSAPLGASAKFLATGFATGIALTQMTNLLLNGKVSDDPFNVTLGYRKDGTQVKANMYFAGMQKDLTTAFNDVKDLGPFGGAIKFGSNKLAPFVRNAAELIGNKDYYGNQIFSPGKGFLGNTAEGLRYAATNVVPLPFTVGSPAQLFFGSKGNALPLELGLAATGLGQISTANPKKDVYNNAYNAAIAQGDSDLAAQLKGMNAEKNIKDIEDTLQQTGASGQEINQQAGQLRDQDKMLQDVTNQTLYPNQNPFTQAWNILTGQKGKQAPQIDPGLLNMTLPNQPTQANPAQTLSDLLVPKDYAAEKGSTATSQSPDTGFKLPFNLPFGLGQSSTSNKINYGTTTSSVINNMVNTYITQGSLSGKQQMNLPIQKKQLQNLVKVAQADQTISEEQRNQTIQMLNDKITKIDGLAKLDKISSFKANPASVADLEQNANANKSFISLIKQSEGFSNNPLFTNDQVKQAIKNKGGDYQTAYWATLKGLPTDQKSSFINAFLSTNDPNEFNKNITALMDNKILTTATISDLANQDIITSDAANNLRSMLRQYQISKGTLSGGLSGGTLATDERYLDRAMLRQMMFNKAFFPTVPLEFQNPQNLPVYRNVPLTMAPASKISAKLAPLPRVGMRVPEPNVRGLTFNLNSMPISRSQLGNIQLGAIA